MADSTVSSTTTLCVCTGLLVQHCAYVQDCRYNIVCMCRTTGTALCICTGLLIQHCVYVRDCQYSTVCMYRTAGTALCVCTGLLVQHCVYVQDCWYSTVCMYRTAGTALCVYTGLLVQNSLTVITINSSLTQRTVGAERMFTDVYYAISCQLSTVHIVTQCDIKTTNLPHTHLTHFTTTNNNCTTFICTNEN